MPAWPSTSPGKAACAGTGRGVAGVRNAGGSTRATARRSGAGRVPGVRLLGSWTDLLATAKEQSVLDTPWARPEVIEAIPEPVTSQVLAEMDEMRFARLIRDHLVPRQPAGPERHSWDTLWDLLREDDELADRTVDVLDDFLAAIDTALAAEGSQQLDERQTKRASKFARFCEDAWHRLEEDSGPLAWAGKAGRGFTPGARRVIATLVDAIDTHRTIITAAGPGEARAPDRELWDVLPQVGLDPARRRRRR
jgi:hypothetical protein